MRLPVALTIAGSDSGGGAGIQADIKTFFCCGVHGACAITSVTSQNTLGVEARFDLPVEVVVAQIEAVTRDMEVHSTKTGMLARTATIEAVAAVLAEHGAGRLVVDPVALSTSGHLLLDEGGMDAMAGELFPLASMITPNLAEASMLLGVDIRDLEAMKRAAVRLRDMGPGSVLVKGGHLEGSSEAVDIFYDGSELATLTSARVETINTHGTGCMLSAAIAAYLARGDTPLRAAERAKEEVVRGLRNALELGKGRGPVHPQPAGAGNEGT